MDGDCAMGSEAGTSLASNGTAAAATSTPSAPPASASTRLSVINWRTSRSRPAPMAALTASSLWRASPRASSRFARFAQAISSTQIAAPLSATQQQARLLATNRRAAGRPMRRGLPILFRKLPLQLAATTPISARGLRQRNARLQPRHHIEIVIVAVLEVVAMLLESHRHPEFGFAARKMEIARHHADDLIRLVIQIHAPPDHAGVAAEYRLPQLVAQQQRSGRAFAVLRGGEQAAHSRLHAQQAETDRR